MWRNRRKPRGLQRWVKGEGTVKTTLIAGLAELIGTSILIFLGCMGCISGFDIQPIFLHITLTFGFAVMVVIQCIGHISQAHINPAVTVGAVILGKKTIPEALVYFVSQMIGATLGYGMLKVVTPKDNLITLDQTDMICVTKLHSNLSVIQGLLVESIATGILMLVVCSIWDTRNEKYMDSVPIKFGLTVVVLGTTVGPYTGCSLNPARSFAPALWNNKWTHHWVYWFGPIGGAMTTALMYKIIFGVSKKVEEEEPIPETVALNSVEINKTES
ncbi:aquaporin isoform X3 [Monomorium pharaonis]|uniref:aquaporin isoform X3 n=1 Tax=Monomorium pharaonis TaxID=307658 RepID=UPI00063EFAA6|nr:aquaporin isoform X3 [Monomorium pharaonis]